eukprot:XP_001705434.1 Hypothetical protein GL50803_23079 [Giardia lamblia ATCC 50803]
MRTVTRMTPHAGMGHRKQQVNDLCPDSRIPIIVRNTSRGPGPMFALLVHWAAKYGTSRRPGVRARRAVRADVRRETQGTAKARSPRKTFQPTVRSSRNAEFQPIKAKRAPWKTDSGRTGALTSRQSSRSLYARSILMESQIAAWKPPASEASDRERPASSSRARRQSAHRGIARSAAPNLWQHPAGRAGGSSGCMPGGIKIINAYQRWHPDGHPHSPPGTHSGAASDTPRPAGPPGGCLCSPGQPFPARAPRARCGTHAPPRL